MEVESVGAADVKEEAIVIKMVLGVEVKTLAATIVTS